MNEFTIKKIAEVYAFCTLARTIHMRTQSTLPKYAPQATTALADIASTLPNASQIPHQNIFAPKVEKTVTKLTTMMELYIGDEWDNPVEVLEWLSFFSGAGSAHAQLATNACRQHDTQLAEQLSTVSTHFDHLLEVVKGQLAQTGSDRA